MGPTPEPLPPNEISDERLPPPVVFLSEEEHSDDGLEIPLNDEYPPGYIPIQQHLEVQWASDSGEDDTDTDVNLNEDPQASQSPSIEHSQQDIDYSNLSSLMQAYSTHGPNVVEDGHGLEGVYVDDESVTSAAAEAVATRNINIENALRKLRLKTEPNLEHSPKDSKVAFNSEPLDKERENAVLAAMQGFSLPQTAIPDWAANVDDGDLCAIVKDRIKKPN